MNAKIITVANLKGGVGKSTTTVNLAHYAAKILKLKTLVIDLDAQINSSRTLSHEWPESALSASTLFIDSALEAPFSISETMSLIPGDDGLKSVDSLVNSNDVEGRRALYQKFRANVRKFKDSFDVIVIDTPTTAEHRYYSALVAADVSITPALLDAYSLQGANDLNQSLENTKALFGNPRHIHIGILPNMYAKKSRLHNDSLAALEAAGIAIVPFTLTSRLAVQESIDAGNPVWLGSRDGRINAAASREWKRACKYVLNEVLA